MELGAPRAGENQASSSGPPAALADSSTAPLAGPFLTSLVIVLRWTMVAVTILSIFQWLEAMGVRLTNPYPVEWLEGAFVAHSLRVLNHQPIYIAPSAEFIPNLYPPFAYWVQAMAMKWIGPGLPAARCVSVLATVGVAYFMGAIVYRRTRSWMAALAVAGIFFDAYATCAGWYDQARNDMLFLFLGLASLFIVTGRPTYRAAIAAALLASLSAWTRQQGLAFLALGCLHLCLSARKQALAFAVTALVVNVPAVYLVNRASDGWFLRYTWTTLGDYTIHYDRMTSVLKMFVANLTLLFLAILLWLGINLRLRRFSHIFSVWGLACGLFTLSAFVAMIKEGGYVNHFIPVIVFSLLLLGFSIGDFAREKRHPRALAIALSLLILQYVVWPHPSRALIPSEIRASQRDVVEEIQSHPGPVLALDDPYYLHLAGKPMHADGGTIFWLSQMGLELPADLAAKVARQHYEVILLAKPIERGMHSRSESARELYRLINDHYTFSRRIVPEDGAVKTLRMPNYLYLPRPKTSDPAAGAPAT